VPLVSVVIPTFNRADTIGRAIGSVLTQTHTDFEVIVVDDGSSDGTKAAVARWDEPRLRYVPLSSNAGAPQARNVGIDLAQGEFVAFLDSDDRWCRRKLELQLESFTAALRGPVAAPPGLILCGYEAISPRSSTTVVPGILRERNVSARSFFAGAAGPFTASIMMITRGVVTSGIRFDPDLPALQDWEFALSISTRFSIVGTRARCAQKFTGTAGPSSPSHVYSRTRANAARKMILQKYEADLQALPHTRRTFVGRLGVELAVAGDRQAAQDLLRQEHRQHCWTCQADRSWLLAVVRHAPRPLLQLVSSARGSTWRRVAQKIGQRINPRPIRRRAADGCGCPGG
jgi:glycosyltransferase involved in cell wall biosynthesis